MDRESIRNMYERYLMDTFTSGYRDFLKTTGDMEDANLYSHFLRKSAVCNEDDKAEVLVQSPNDAAAKRSWSTFVRYCAQLVDMQSFDPILRFMYGVFLHPTLFDLSGFYAALKTVKISADLTLDRLCSDFYRLVKTEERLGWMQKDDITLPEDLYHEDYSAIENGSTIPFPKIVALMPTFLASQLYDITITAPYDVEDVDRIASSAVRISQAKLTQEQQSIIAFNERQEEVQKLWKEIPMPRQVFSKTAPFDREFVIPGALLPIFKASEVSGNNQLCYDILEKHVFRFMSEVPWDQVYRTEVKQIGVLMSVYADFFFSLVLKANYHLHIQEQNFIYSEPQLLQELLEGEGPIMNEGRILFSQYPDLGKFLMQMLHKGKRILKSTVRDHHFSFLMAITPYILVCSGQSEVAADFLVNHFNDISPSERNAYYVQIVLVRTILDTQQAETANILYGYYCYELDRQRRELPAMQAEFFAIADYLVDCENYIRDSNKITYNTQMSWHNVLFSDGRIHTIVANVRALCQQGHLPNRGLYKDLMCVIEAFSYPLGIRLKLLGLPDQDNYDKLPNALPKELIQQGRGYWERDKDYQLFLQSMALFDQHKIVAILSQDHIAQLTDREINQSLVQIDRLKQAIADNAGEQETANLLAEIGAIADKLGQKLLTAQNCSAIEAKFVRLQKEFLQKYLPEERQYDLLLKLPKQAHDTAFNYLITAELVYHILSARQDAKELDFHQ